MTGWLFVLALLGPPCGDDPGRSAGDLLAEINAARAQRGQALLRPHPVLCDLAVARARQIVRSGDATPPDDALRNTTRELYAAGYRPHDWFESSVVGARAGRVLEDWRSVDPDAWLRILEGDYESLGVGHAQLEGRSVLTIVAALSSKTWSSRQVEPLRDLAAMRSALLAASNGFRAAEGREPLVASPELDAAAQGHAESMRDLDFYDHRDPAGRSPSNRVRDAGYPRPRRVSENIAKGLFTPEQVVERWMNSPGHRANLLHRTARDVGFGVAVVETELGYEALWVQLFASQ